MQVLRLFVLVAMVCGFAFAQEEGKEPFNGIPPIT